LVNATNYLESIIEKAKAAEVSEVCATVAATRLQEILFILWAVTENAKTAR
jgi:hypothetical protein